MKLKYTIQRDLEQHLLIIREYAELDKDILSLVCEESYDEDIIKLGLAKNREALLGIIRTDKLYPPILFVNPICDAVVEIFEAQTSEDAREIQFDDLDFITKDPEKFKPVDTEEDEAGDIDDLLDEDYEEDYEDKDGMQNINTSL
jgi:hypothetical protein